MHLVDDTQDDIRLPKLGFDDAIRKVFDASPGMLAQQIRDDLLGSGVGNGCVDHCLESPQVGVVELAEPVAKALQLLFLARWRIRQLADQIGFVDRSNHVLSRLLASALECARHDVRREEF